MHVAADDRIEPAVEPTTHRSRHDAHLLRALGVDLLLRCASHSLGQPSATPHRQRQEHPLDQPAADHAAHFLIPNITGTQQIAMTDVHPIVRIRDPQRNTPLVNRDIQPMAEGRPDQEVSVAMDELHPHTPVDQSA